MEDRREPRSGALERRGAERFEIRADVEFLVGGVLYVATAENLSTQGAFVATEIGVFHRMPVDVSLTLDPDAEPLKLVGKVVRLARRRDERPGFAIEFDAMDDATRARIEQAVDAR
ncbi:MAG: PilZ domain-containing protein [Myxococcota bacterium]